MAELLPMDAEKQQAYYDQLNDAVGESLAYFMPAYASTSLLT